MNNRHGDDQQLVPSGGILEDTEVPGQAVQIEITPAAPALPSVSHTADEEALKGSVDVPNSFMGAGESKLSQEAGFVAAIANQKKESELAASDLKEGNKDEVTKTKPDLSGSDDSGQTGNTTQAAPGDSEGATEVEKTEDELFKEKVESKMSTEEVCQFVEDIVKWLNERTVFNTPQVKSRVKYLDRSYWRYRSRREHVAKALLSSGFPAVSVKMLKEFNRLGVFSSDDVWFPTYYIYHVTWNYTDAALDLSKSFGEEGLIKILLANMSHQPYLDNMESKNVGMLIKSSLSTLHNISKVPEVKHIYKENNALEVLKPFLSSNNEFFQGLTAMTLANLVDENENDILKETGCFSFLSTCLRKALANTKIRRHRGFSPVELVEGLGHLAVNDSNKQKIIEVGVLPSLVIMMSGDIIEEQKVAARCCWTLAFDKEARQSLKDEEGCIKALEALTESDQNIVKKMATGALWQIQEKGEQQLNTSEEKKGDQQQKHVFISYNHKHAEIVHKIANRLQGDGHDIWIDVEKMGGSTIEAMASAVENASVVIICMSENYKLSPACQSEAEYAYRRQVPIVPLMMQRHYKTDGWLGFIIGTKLYINFDGKFTFDLAYQKLTKELQSNIGPSVDSADGVPGGPIQAVTVSHVGAQPATTRKSSATSWTKDDIMKWLSKHGLEGYKDHFEDYDGKILLGIKRIRDEAPEFFYGKMERQIFQKMTDLVRFTQALDDLG